MRLKEVLKLVDVNPVARRKQDGAARGGSASAEGRGSLGGKKNDGCIDGEVRQVGG